MDKIASKNVHEIVYLTVYEIVHKTTVLLKFWLFTSFFRITSLQAIKDKDKPF